MSARAAPLALLVALALALGLGACAIEHRTSGRPLPSRETLAALQPGRSTMDDALALLGGPLSVRRTFGGELWTWRRSASSSRRLLLVPLFPVYEWARGEGGSDRLSLLFDEAGVLRSVGVARDTGRVADEPGEAARAEHAASADG